MSKKIDRLELNKHEGVSNIYSQLNSDHELKLIISYKAGEYIGYNLDYINDGRSRMWHINRGLNAVLYPIYTPLYYKAVKALDKLKRKDRALRQAGAGSSYTALLKTWMRKHGLVLLQTKEGTMIACVPLDNPAI